MHHDRLGRGEDLAPFFWIAQNHFIRIGAFRQGGHTHISLQAGFVPQQTVRIEADLVSAVQGVACQLQPA